MQSREMTFKHMGMIIQALQELEDYAIVVAKTAEAKGKLATALEKVNTEWVSVGNVFHVNGSVIADMTMTGTLPLDVTVTYVRFS